MVVGVGCLNPFEIRGGLKRETFDITLTGDGLNPFEIRGGLKPAIKSLSLLCLSLNPFEIRGGLKPYASEIRCGTTACRGLYGRSQVVGEMSLQASFQAFGGGIFAWFWPPAGPGAGYLWVECVFLLLD